MNVSRRNQNRQLYEFGPFRVDVAEQVLTKGEHVIPLTPKAFDTLVVLVVTADTSLKRTHCSKRCGRTPLLKRVFWLSMSRRSGKR